MIRASDVTVVVPTIPGRDWMLARALRSVDQLRPGCGDIVIAHDVDRRGSWWCRNKAIEEVRSGWIAFLDDDDELLDNHLGVLVRAAHKTGADMVYSYARFVGDRDPLACCQNGQLVAQPINVPFGDDQRAHLDSRRSEYCDRCSYLRGNFIPITYLVRTELVRAVGGFPKPYSMPDVRTSGECEDYLLLLRMLDAGATFHHVPTRTWVYHIHASNTGGRGADRMHELDGSEPASTSST